MRLKIQKEKLEDTIRNFHQATGIRMAVLDADFSNIVSLDDIQNSFCSIAKSYDSQNRCYLSDLEILTECSKTRTPQMHICHAGLIDIALPIIHNDTIMGYIIMGQMRRDIPFKKIEECLSWIGADKENLKKAYADMVIYDDERAKSIAKLAVMLAAYIISEDMISEEYNPLIERITAFIRDNIRESLSVDDICRGVNVSKNTLYRNMHIHLGMSVNEYVMSQRLSLARKLLSSSKDSISSICESVGISNSSYFCKLFKSSTGMSPTKYRRMKQ